MKPTLQERIAKMSPYVQETVRLVAEAIKTDPSLGNARELFNERTRSMKLWEAGAVKDMAFELAKK